MNSTQQNNLSELDQAKLIFKDAIESLPLTPGQKYSLIAAVSSLEKAAVNHGAK